MGRNQKLRIALSLFFSMSMATHAVAQSHAPSSRSQSSVSQPAGKLVSDQEARNLECLEFNEKSPYRIHVTFNKALSTSVKKGDSSYIIRNGSLSKSKKSDRVGKHCEIFHSTLSSPKGSEKQLHLKANSPYAAEHLVSRLNDKSTGRQLRGCRINLKTPGSDSITSLQCFVPGGGEATIGDIQDALGAQGHVQVRRK